jgi:hypothetical protein
MLFPPAGATDTSAWNVQSEVVGTATISLPDMATSVPSRLPWDQSFKVQEDVVPSGMVKRAWVAEIVGGRGTAANADSESDAAVPVAPTTMVSSSARRALR